MGFTQAYSSVTWTSGDVITEAKLDAMVANDQAYDSHAAQGLELNEMAKPSTPAADKIRLYAKDKAGVSTLYYLKDDGSEVEIGASIISNTQYAPQGFLINGLIVPSVTGNNLTVAIKGMDGNDPSATNPVTIRIGDVVHVITTALSKTLNAGANYFNAGSSELATQEIDYFVYLGYNATDGVTLGFARFPSAKIYSDFSTTNTNEKYCAISNISHAAAGDIYEVIGRFAATLSSGAGYTWSVPTFTASNLIQRPIYDTRWLTWLPTMSASGSMTYTSITYAHRKYKISNGIINLKLRVLGTTGGSASGNINSTVPFSRLENTAYVNAGAGQALDNGGNGITGQFVWNGSSQTLIVGARYDGNNFSLSNNNGISYDSYYEY